jgi:hypothetical protein
LILKLKEKFSPSFSTFTAANVFQFGKGPGKIWGVWCKGVLCLVMSDLKHNKISNLRSLIIASLPLEYKEFL